MKLKQLASNMTELHLEGVGYVLFSYETPVAAVLANGSNIKTSKKWSVTTSKHITKWINLSTFKGIFSEVDQSVLDSLVGGN